MDQGVELAKLARRDGQGFDCATWLHKARAMPKDQFKHEVQKELTGQETEPWEIIYFKLYKSQIPVIEQALETLALMLGTDRSRGYCLEMICADFLAGANLNGGDPDVLFARAFQHFQIAARRTTADFSPFSKRRHIVNCILGRSARLRLEADAYETLRKQVLRRDSWRCQCCGTMSNLEVHHKQFRSRCVDDLVFCS